MMQYPSNFSLANALDARLLKFTNQCDEKLDEGDENESMSPLVETVSENDEIVFDGGYLLHQLIRQKELTFRDFASKYVHYIDLHYGQCTVAFDSYCENASIKDYEHKTSRC